MLEYLPNNDTQRMRDEVCRLAQNDEPALRRECQEVSRCADTSSLDAKEKYLQKAGSINTAFAKIADALKGLSQSLSGGSVFGTRDGKAMFGIVCRAVTSIEEARRELLIGVGELTQVRQRLFSAVAEANRALHFLKTARQAVPEELRAPYDEAVACCEDAYERLKCLDASLCEEQSFCMTFIECHLPAFMERVRKAADFNRTGEALDTGAIRTLCNEALIVINRAPNITF